MSCSPTTPTTLLSLPPELRQRIFLLTLEDENIPAKLPHLTASARRLTQTCKTIRSDMRWVLSHHTPTYGFQTPALFGSFLSDLRLLQDSEYQDDSTNKAPTTLPAYDYLPPITTISFSIFHEARVPNMHWTCYCRGPEYRTHPELIDAWVAATPLIPPSVTTVMLDVTPAPGWMRAQRPDWIPNFVQDKRVAKRFVTDHRDHLIRLVQVLRARGLEVQLIGLLSAKSATFLADMVSVGADRGVDVVFTGRMQPVESTRKAPWLVTAMQNLAPVRYGWLDEEQARTSLVDGEGTFGRLPPRDRFEVTAARLGSTNWGTDTVRLWGNAAAEDKPWATNVLRRFVELVRDKERAEEVFEPVDNRRRALLHHLAKDLGFMTESIGEREGRYVRVYRQQTERKGEEGGEIDLEAVKDLMI